MRKNFFTDEDGGPTGLFFSLTLSGAIAICVLIIYILTIVEKAGANDILGVMK